MRASTAEQGELSGRQLLAAVERRGARAALLANGLGGLDVFLFTALLLPTGGSPKHRLELTIANGVLATLMFALAFVVARRIALRLARGATTWLVEERPPTPDELQRVLRVPFLQARLSAAAWGVAVVIFGLLNIPFWPAVAGALAVSIAIGGISTSAMHYLLVERVWRPITVRALAAGVPERPAGPGVGGRVIIVWALASGALLLGLAAVGVAGLLGTDVDRRLLPWTVLVLALLALGVGLTATTFVARSLAEPLAAVRRALARIEGGDLDAEVPVEDGSELGLVEAGFNRMAAGLRERERMRDLFGRHVGRDVAIAALDGGVQLGGEVRAVAVLMVDLVGSTALASRLPPERVVALLNRFFELVVRVVEAHGGLVNKFEGDGALCVFGAPVARDDPAGAALAAAGELHARLIDELPEVDAGISVSAGEAVAGNVGAEERFEYTVIGDPVNEVARLCELAKRREERVLASEAAVSRADAREAARWSVGEATQLRGRTEPTRLATPAREGVRRPLEAR